MRQIEHDAWHGRAKRIEDGIERLVAEIVDALERRGRSEEAQIVGAFRQQPIDKSGIDAFRGEHGVGDALRRILVEIEPGGPECEIEIGDDRIRD